MKGWLSRAVASTAIRGEEPRNRLARWSRYFPKTPAVDEVRFQSPDEPYPGHWREFPAPWPQTGLADPAVSTHLRDAIGELPETWRDVVTRRDVEGRDPAEVATELGLTAGQQRAILNRARAFLREQLARFLNRAHSQ